MRSRDKVRGKAAHGARQDNPATLQERAGVGGWTLWTYCLALTICGLIWTTVHPLMDPDVWLHMAFGRFVLCNHAFPSGDIFSFTAAGREWMSSGWAASVLLEFAHSRFGAAGLGGLASGLVAAAYLSVYCVAARRGDPCTAATLLLAAMGASSLRFTPRPEAFSQAFLAAALLLLCEGARGASGAGFRCPRRMWALPLLFALWANFHAGFLVGLAPAGLCGAWLAQQWRRTGNRQCLAAASVCALCFAAWALNPYGVRIAFLTGKVKSLPNLKEIVYEWRPLFASSTLNLPGAAAALLGLLAGACAWVASRRLVPWWQTGVMVVFAGLALYEIRHAGLAALAMAALAAQRMRLPGSGSVRRIAGPALAAAALVALAAMQYRGMLGFGSGWPRAGLDDSLMPVTATRYLEANRPPANMYNSYGPGGYLLYWLGPETKVFMDGRNDVYEPGVWNAFWDIQDGRIGLDDASARYGLNTFFIYCPANDANPRNLANRLGAHPQWKLVYFDDAYALFVRETVKTAAYTQPRAFRHISPFALDGLYGAVADPERRPAVWEEIRHALAITGGCAKANLLAGAAARAAGDEVAALGYFKTAAARNPFAAVGMPKGNAQ